MIENVDPTVVISLTAAHLALVLVLAGLNTKLVDYLIEPIRKKYPSADLWWAQYISFVTGMLIGWFTQVNLFAGLVPPDSAATIVGRVLTSAALGAGSSLIHDWLDKAPWQPRHGA